jgi:hypothetical protein
MASTHGWRRPLAIEVEMDQFHVLDVCRSVNQCLEQDGGHGAPPVDEDAVTTVDQTDGELGRGGGHPREILR